MTFFGRDPEKPAMIQLENYKKILDKEYEKLSQDKDRVQQIEEKIERILRNPLVRFIYHWMERGRK